MARRLARLVLLLLAATMAPAWAQGAAAAVPPAAPAEAAAAPAAPAARVRRPRLAIRPTHTLQEYHLGRPAAPPAPAGQPLAPMPNRELELPPEFFRPDPRAPSLTPNVITRRLPRNGFTQEGAGGAREDRLFAPAAGARLSLPFSY